MTYGAENGRNGDGERLGDGVRLDIGICVRTAQGGVRLHGDRQRARNWVFVGGTLDGQEGGGLDRIAERNVRKQGWRKTNAPAVGFVKPAR